MKSPNKKPTNKSLRWVKKTLSDKSGSWFEATIPPLQWAYTVEDYPVGENRFLASVFLGPSCDPLPLHKTPKSLEETKKICENHLKKTLEKLQAYR